MSQTIVLGPLALQAGLLIGLAVFLGARYIGMRLAAAGSAGFERQLLRAVLIGVLAARLAFVLQYLDTYLVTPWRMIDIRDGGWHWGVGLAAGAVFIGAVALRRQSLRRPLFAAAVAGVLIWTGGALAMLATQHSETQLPPLQLRTLEGAAVELASFAGKPTVVNLWATWCPPCQREMPVLQRAQAARPDLNFVFLNQGEDAARVQRYLAASGLSLRNVLLDTRSEAGRALGHRALPATLFFDSKGRLVDSRVGELSQASLQQRLLKLVSP